MTKKGSITILSPSTKTKTVVSFRDGPSFRSSSVSVSNSTRLSLLENPIFQPRSCASHEKTCGAKSPQPSLAQLVHLSHDTTAGSFSDQYQKPLLVLKVGTSTIMETTTANFCLSNLGTFVDCVCNMKEQGYQVRKCDEYDNNQKYDQFICSFHCRMNSMAIMMPRPACCFFIT